MKQLKSIPIAYSVYREGDNPIYGDSATNIEIHDEGGGAFVQLLQPSSEIDGQISLEIEELEMITKVSKKLIDTYESYPKL